MEYTSETRAASYEFIKTANCLPNARLLLMHWLLDNDYLKIAEGKTASELLKFVDRWVSTEDE